VIAGCLSRNSDIFGGFGFVGTTAAMMDDDDDDGCVKHKDI
jgi:hypothetical protein